MNRNFILTDQAIIFKQSHLMKKDKTLLTAHNPLPDLLKYKAT